MKVKLYKNRASIKICKCLKENFIQNNADLFRNFKRIFFCILFIELLFILKYAKETYIKNIISQKKIFSTCIQLTRCTKTVTSIK